MVTQTIEPLSKRTCRPCEGHAKRYSRDEAEAELHALSGWRITPDGLRIEKSWLTKDFMAAIDFFDRVALVAEQEGHHPDLHLSGYRHVAIELSTHAIGGLSENDFIMAAKIDLLPVELKPGAG